MPTMFTSTSWTIGPRPCRTTPTDRRDGWVKGAQPREIIQVKNKDNKLTWPEPHDYLRGKPASSRDLVPATILVARYFAVERDAIEALDNQLATLEQQLDEMREENSGEEGLLAEVIEGEGDKQKIAAKAVKAHLKDRKDPLYADERTALEAYTELLEQQTEAKAKRKAAQEGLDKKDRRQVSQAQRGRDQNAGGGRQVDGPCIGRRAGRAGPRVADPHQPASANWPNATHSAAEAHRGSGDARRPCRQAPEEDGAVWK